MTAWPVPAHIQGYVQWRQGEAVPGPRRLHWQYLLGFWDTWVWIGLNNAVLEVLAGSPKE